MSIRFAHIILLARFDISLNHFKYVVYSLNHFKYISFNHFLILYDLIKKYVNILY